MNPAERAFENFKHVQLKPVHPFDIPISSFNREAASLPPTHPWPDPMQESNNITAIVQIIITPPLRIPLAGLVEIHFHFHFEFNTKISSPAVAWWCVVRRFCVYEIPYKYTRMFVWYVFLRRPRTLCVLRTINFLIANFSYARQSGGFIKSEGNVPNEVSVLKLDSPNNEPLEKTTYFSWNYGNETHLRRRLQMLIFLKMSAVSS